MSLRSPRVSEWRGLLREHITANRQLIHSYNPEQGMDCARWTGSARAVVTGAEYPLLTRAKYKTAAGAMSYIQAQGCKTIDEVTDKVLGARHPITFAGAGDVVLGDLAKLNLSGGLPQMGLVPGICNGTVSYFVGETGLVEVRTLSLECCYYE
jgi:hypothetical protein